MKLRIITNVAGIEKCFHPRINIEHLRYPNKKNHSFLTILKFLWEKRNYDYLIFNGSGRDLFLMGLFKILFPLQRIRIVSLDLLLPQPRSLNEKIKCMFRRLFLSKVHMFLLYYKDTQGIADYYKIPFKKFRYVPFKINQYEKVLTARTRDCGYIFCGGKTRRDFDTLMEAVRGLKIPVHIVTMENQHIAEHGSHLDESNIPENVKVVKLDGSFDPFLKQMAEARLVVLPLKPHICGTGIGVYIMAMALKKCVIISAGVSVNGVLNHENAIFVPPSDPNALRNAIEKAYYDDKYRNKYEVNGYRYAISLGGEEQLNESITKTIIDDYQGKQ
jgi:glycosyltransferase involved in cell wall biosynthesis